MKRKMFGHISKKRSDSQRVPGEPYNTKGYDRGDENEGSHEYVESKDVKEDGHSEGRARGNPSHYEGKEHIKYREPGYSSHEIRYPQDEPHMKSHIDTNEEHEMGDNYHMEVPDQTHYELKEKIQRARMKMDDPNQQNPKPILGIPVHNVPYKGEEDTSGEEEMGPNHMQSSKMPKEHRKKMIAAMTKRKMNKASARK